MTNLNGRQNQSVADNLGKTFLGPAAEQGIELSQFASLALITHPQAFGLFQRRGPVEQKKDAGPVGLIFRIEHFDACLREPNQRFVFRPGLLRRVLEIGQQSEIEMLVPVRQ